MDRQEAESDVRKFFADKNFYDKVSQNFENNKKKFYEQMDDAGAFFDDGSFMVSGSYKDESFNNKNTKIKVTRVSSVRIKWFVDKLKKKLSKELFSKVTKKSYIISNVNGLFSYLKSLGANPKDVKKYITSVADVDANMIDKLSDLGLISDSQIADCFETSSSRFYKVQNIKED